MSSSVSAAASRSHFPVDDDTQAMIDRFMVKQPASWHVDELRAFADRCLEQFIDYMNQVTYEGKRIYTPVSRFLLAYGKGDASQTAVQRDTLRFLEKHHPTLLRSSLGAKQWHDTMPKPPVHYLAKDDRGLFAELSPELIRLLSTQKVWGDQTIMEFTYYEGQKTFKRRFEELTTKEQPTKRQRQRHRDSRGSAGRRPQITDDAPVATEKVATPVLDTHERLAMFYKGIYDHLQKHYGYGPGKDLLTVFKNKILTDAQWFVSLQKFCSFKVSVFGVLLCLEKSLEVKKALFKLVYDKGMPPPLVATQQLNGTKARTLCQAPTPRAVTQELGAYRLLAHGDESDVNILHYLATNATKLQAGASDIAFIGSMALEYPLFYLHLWNNLVEHVPLDNLQRDVKATLVYYHGLQELALAAHRHLDDPSLIKPAQYKRLTPPENLGEETRACHLQQYFRQALQQMNEAGAVASLPGHVESSDDAGADEVEILSDERNVDGTVASAAPLSTAAATRRSNRGAYLLAQHIQQLGGYNIPGDSSRQGSATPFIQQTVQSSLFLPSAGGAATPTSMPHRYNTGRGVNTFTEAVPLPFGALPSAGSAVADHAVAPPQPDCGPMGGAYEQLLQQLFQHNAMAFNPYGSTNPPPQTFSMPILSFMTPSAPASGPLSEGGDGVTPPRLTACLETPSEPSSSSEAELGLWSSWLDG